MEIQRLVTLVSPHIQRATRCNFALSPEVQLLAALRFHAVGSFLEVVGDGTGFGLDNLDLGLDLGIAFTECGSCDTDPPAPCPDTHQNAHHTGQGPPDPPWISCHGWDPPGDWCIILL